MPSSSTSTGMAPMRPGEPASALPGQAPTADAPAPSRPDPPHAPHIIPVKLPDWNNLKVIHRNTLPPRAHFFLYENREDALSRDVARSKSQLLSGQWQFHLSKSPLDGPVDFHRHNPVELEFSHGWGGQTIRVPGMWQLQGYGKGPHYTNLNFPFPVDPPRVPIDDNECGRYATSFQLTSEDEGTQFRLRFEGVDSAFTLWVNHHEVGYSQGSRNPSEFDITPFVRCPGTNFLHVEVYQRCDGSYIEDQVRLNQPYRIFRNNEAHLLCRINGGSVASSVMFGCTSFHALTSRTFGSRPGYLTTTKTALCMSSSGLTTKQK